MTKFFTVITTVLFIFASCTNEKAIISEMRCEYLQSPINIDAAKPRFTWIYESNTGKFTQHSYQIAIAMSKKALEDGDYFWTSEKITNKLAQSSYNGDKTLTPQTKYYWRVTSFDEKNNAIVSPVDSFEMAKMEMTDWTAKWITDKHDKSFGPAPMFRKSFTIDKEIESAKLYISAAAYYLLFINGEKAGKEKLDPGYTHYDKRNLYTTMDITTLLQKGENVVATVLGNGFYNEDAPVATWDFEKARWRDRAKMIMEIDVLYSDGTKLVIPTDDTWKTAIGPHIYNNIYSGETYDARKEITIGTLPRSTTRNGKTRFLQ